METITITQTEKKIQRGKNMVRSPTMRKYLLICGIISPLVYVAGRVGTDLYWSLLALDDGVGHCPIAPQNAQKTTIASEGELLTHYSLK